MLKVPLRRQFNTEDGSTCFSHLWETIILFLGCLPVKATVDNLSKYFSKFGNLLDVKLVLDEKGCPKRFAFVTFSRKEEAEEVLKKRKLYLLEKKLNVGSAVKKEEHNFIPDEPVKIVTLARVNIEK